MSDDVDTAVDNDILLKAASYRLTSSFWPNDLLSRIGVLATAAFVLPNYLSRKRLSAHADALAALTELLGAVSALEPVDEEIELAAELEAAAQLASLPLDTGESQLVAIAVTRTFQLLQTGDKRAVRALELLRENLRWVRGLDRRVQCLEQLAQQLLADDGLYPIVWDRICGEADVDTALTICFSCRSQSRPAREQVVAGLESYINDLRRQAPNMVAP